MLAGVAWLVGHLLIHEKVASTIPGQGTGRVKLQAQSPLRGHAGGSKSVLCSQQHWCDVDVSLSTSPFISL